MEKRRTGGGSRADAEGEGAPRRGMEEQREVHLPRLEEPAVGAPERVPPIDPQCLSTAAVVGDAHGRGGPVAVVEKRT